MEEKKLVRIRCAICNREELVDLGTLLNGNWQCYCSSKFWEEVG